MKKLICKYCEQTLYITAKEDHRKARLIIKKHMIPSFVNKGCPNACLATTNKSYKYEYQDLTEAEINKYNKGKL